MNKTGCLTETVRQPESFRPCSWEKVSQPDNEQQGRLTFGEAA